jgi:Chromo (CHRromatin Organisation MOdifier) domain
MKHAQTLLAKRSKQWKGQRHYRGYSKGEKVWLEGTNLKVTHGSSKLAPKRYGPFTTTKVISLVVVRLQLPDHWKIHNIFHTSLIAPYMETAEYGPNYEQPPLELIEGKPEYEVEQVLAARRHGQKKELQYLLKWKGYSAAHNSWEPASNISTPELLQKFYRANPKAIKTLLLGPKATSTNSLTTPTTTPTRQSPMNNASYFHMDPANFLYSPLRGSPMLVDDHSALPTLPDEPSDNIVSDATTILLYLNALKFKMWASEVLTQSDLGGPLWDWDMLAPTKV